jgi:hypothetical protein
MEIKMLACDLIESTQLRKRGGGRGAGERCQEICGEENIRIFLSLINLSRNFLPVKLLPQSLMQSI